MEYGELYKKFDPKPYYRERGWLIGDGSTGGKAKGVSFAHSVLEEHGLLGEVALPEYSFALTTSVFEEYMERNNLWERLEGLRGRGDGPELHRICQNAALPESIDGVLEMILDSIEGPISVRSSSLLEDNVNLSFAGKYATRFIANQEDRKSRRAAFEEGIKTIFASTYNPAAREYKRKHGVKWGGDRMGVLIQPLIGKTVDKMYYPELAGSAFSKVFRRPSPRIGKDDGVARICFGLGTRTVDRSFARTFYLTNPHLRPEGNKPEQIVIHSQEQFDYIDLEKNIFTTRRLSDSINMIIKRHRMAQAFIQWYDGTMFHWLLADTNDMMYPRPVFTFSDLPKRCPKLFARIKMLLTLFEREMRVPVDIEFTYDSTTDVFTMVQLRPLSVYQDLGRVEIPAETAPEKILLKGDRMVANGKLEGVRHIIYVAPEAYWNRTDFHEIARAVGELNMRLEGERYLLIGPGRWGSSNPLLGVPVQYNELSNSGCLVEIGIPSKGVSPELSYGTHFFLDLDGDNILYLPVFDGMKDNIYNREWFDNHPWNETGHPAVRHYIGDFDVLLDGESETGVIIDRSNDSA